MEDDDVVAEAAGREASSGYALGPLPTVGLPSPSTDIEIARAMGLPEIAIMSGDWQSRAAEFRRNETARNLYQAKQAQAQLEAQRKLEAQQADPAFQAQQVYGRLGNLAAARVISKSRGPALFQYLEPLDLGRAGSFHMHPAGYLDVPTPDGKRRRLSASEVLEISGVTTIPYLGGDEEATTFRNVAGMASSVIKMMDQLEEIYEKNGTLVPMSDDYNRAKQIEGQLAPAVQQLRTGSKSMAGTSDLEIAALEKTLPRRTNFTVLPEEAKIALQQTRDQLRALIMNRANRNGIELRLVMPKDRTTSAPPKAGENPKSPIPGVTHGR